MTNDLFSPCVQECLQRLFCSLLREKAGEIVPATSKVILCIVQVTLGLQQPEGHIYWSRDCDGNPWPSAPLAACSSIFRSLTNACHLAAAAGYDRPEWQQAAARLGQAIRTRPDLFDVHGDNRRGYAMTWYYPVLNGVITGREATERLRQGWGEFVISGWGCRCSLDQPWVTVAETCELAMALASLGERQPARTLLEWVLKLQDSNSGFYTGIRLPEEEIYPPGETTTWSAAAVILAALADSELPVNAYL